MFPSDVPNFPKEIHVFPCVSQLKSVKKPPFSRYLPGICQENPSEIQVNFPGIRPEVCLCADANDEVAARCGEFQRCHQLLREDGAVAAGAWRGHWMGPPQRWSRSVA